MDPAKSPVLHKGKAKTMTFSEAIKEIVDGHRVTRLEWDSNSEFGLLKDGFLMIHTKGKYHRWIVSDGDMLNNDWCLLPDTNEYE